MTGHLLPDALTHRRQELIGRHRDELGTPALLLDLAAARRNIAAMAARAAGLHAALRPHVKVHKNPQLARMQVQAGAIGICTATAWEALAMARAGLSDIFVVNQVCGSAKHSALTEAARSADISVAVDDEDNLRALAAAATAAGVEFGVLIDVDTGMKRCGVRNVPEALALARTSDSLTGVRQLGVTGYEGHCMRITARDERAEAARQAMDTLSDVATALRREGHPCSIVSAGGTGTYDMTGCDQRVTEIQAGSYAVMDTFHGRLVPSFETALTVLATVISVHGSDIVTDAGRKALGVDLADPQLPGLDSEVRFVNEEHSGYRITSGTLPQVGDVVPIIPGYAPTTVNLYDAMAVLEDSIVTEIWPVLARYGVGTFL
jgi:D-serine deaminase-like pyridoxal phosphate-dependent protein